MSIISQETWDKFTEEEKEKLRKEYAGILADIAEGSIYDEYRKDEMEELFGKENLQPQPKYKVWSDIEKESPNILQTPRGKYGIDISVNTSHFNEKVIQKCIAALKISRLIELGYGGMVSEEEWRENGRDQGFYCIWANSDGEVECTLVYDSTEFIAFHTQQHAEEFMSYPENVELIRQYYMV